MIASNIMNGRAQGIRRGEFNRMTATQDAHHVILFNSQTAPAKWRAASTFGG